MESRIEMNIMREASRSTFLPKYLSTLEHIVNCVANGGAYHQIQNYWVSISCELLNDLS